MKKRYLLLFLLGLLGQVGQLFFGFNQVRCAQGPAGVQALPSVNVILNINESGDVDTILRSTPIPKFNEKPYIVLLALMQQGQTCGLHALVNSILMLNSNNSAETVERLHSTIHNVLFETARSILLEIRENTQAKTSMIIKQKIDTINKLSLNIEQNTTLKNALMQDLFSGKIIDVKYYNDQVTRYNTLLKRDFAIIQELTNDISFLQSSCVSAGDGALSGGEIEAISRDPRFISVCQSNGLSYSPLSLCIFDAPINLKHEQIMAARNGNAITLVVRDRSVDHWSSMKVTKAGVVWVTDSIPHNYQLNHERFDQIIDSLNR
ncbi:MAG: hypothetical protein HQK53_12900 [Oligoflexia bacterium]|nr:hypothetical protein [Oligoflexia bacterium]